MSIKITKDIIVGEKLLSLAGPCAAESYEICARTAEYMKGLCEELDINYVFKASFDKANRSSVDSFRGPGLDEGLELLAKITHVPADRSRFRFRSLRHFVRSCVKVHDIKKVSKNCCIVILSFSIKRILKIS